MTKYDREKIMRSIQFGYCVAGVAILALCVLVFSTAWFSYELQRQNELLREQLEKTEQVSDGGRVQVRSIEGSGYRDQETYRRFDDAGERPLRGRNA